MPNSPGMYPRQGNNGAGWLQSPTKSPACILHVSSHQFIDIATECEFYPKNFSRRPVGPELGRLSMLGIFLLTNHDQLFKQKPPST